MRVLRTVSVAATAVILTLLVTPAPANASFSQPFNANSGDSCRYGATQGYSVWRYSTTAPIRPISIDVRGSLVDHPVPNENFLCRDDNYRSVATFTAYAGAEIIRGEETADNAIVPISLTLAPTASTAGITRLVVQVCRYPLDITQPPAVGYCGAPQSYAPVVYDPPRPVA